MAAPVNANINVLVNTQQAMAQLRALQGQVATLNSSISATSGAAAAQQAALAKGLKDSANASRMWQARIVPMNTATQQFSQALDKGRMSLGQYTRFAASQLPGMSRVFKREFEMMNRVATQNVRQMQTQYVQLGRSATGAAQAMALTPTALNKHASAAAVAAQRQMMMNRMIDLGTTKLLNWGKNTQWAGRQLMVGFSIPLAMVGAIAAKAFKEIDKGSIAFKRVYGDLSTTTAEMERNLEAVKALGNEYTRYGLKLADTIELAADVAATGAKNESLMAATEQTLRLATLGLMEYGEALEATVALQTAFQVSNEDLAGTIDFLNVVENETILTMQDMAAAIPRVAPVVKGLGGDVKDLAVFMTAMREGGVTAEQGANALKSGLGRLINPTKAAREVMEGFGLSIDAIIQSNRGDLMGMMQDFGNALATLGDFEQQQVLEKVFGKYQYARLGALFKNLANDASQANRTIELTNMSMEDLARISERELSKIEEATSTKFQAAVERLKVSIAPIGEQFMKALMPVIDFVTKIANKFNDLPDGIKNAISIGVAAIAGIGPIVLMTVGLIANGIANIGKLVQTMRKFFARLKGDSSAFNYLTQEEREAATAANALSGATDGLTGKFLGQRRALESLVVMVNNYTKALAGAAAAAPLGFGMGTPAAVKNATARGTVISGPRTGGTIVTGPGGLRMAKGGLVPGTGNKDTVPAMLTPGESVVTKEATQKYGPMIQAMNAGVKIPGFVSGVVDLSRLSGSYLTGSAKPISPIAVMQPGVGGNQSAVGVSRREFGTPMGQAAFAAAGKAAADFATRMETLNRFSMSALQAFDPLDDLFNRMHAEVNSQLRTSATIDEAITRAKPEVDKILSDYIKQKTLNGQITKAEASRLRVATRLLMGEQSTIARVGGLARAERVDVRGGQVSNVRTQTVQTPGAAGAPLATFRRMPQVTEREFQRRGISTPASFAQWQRSHLMSVGSTPYRGGMIEPRVQGRGLSAQERQAIQRVATQEAQVRNQTLERNTQDTAIIARDRNSPHPIVTKDAQSDARQYANTVKQTLMGLTPIRTGKPLVAASTPNLPQGTQFRAPGGGVAQVYNPRNNPLGLGVTGEARAARGAVAAIESRTGILNRLRAEEEAQLAASKKFRVVDNRRTGATTKSAVLLEEENSFLTRANQAAQRLAAQRELNLTALRAEEQAQARLNGAKQRAAVMQETMNQRPARGGILDRPLGAIRRLAFPGGQDAALKNLGFNQFSGQVKTAGQLIVESAKGIKIRVAGAISNISTDFKLATQKLLADAKNAGTLLKSDFKNLGGTIKTNMQVDLNTIKTAATNTATAIRNLGTSAASAAQRMAGGIANFMNSVDKNGTTRMQKFGQAGNGAVMGLMGLSMAASFAGGEVGEMAQKIMPITMGLMGLQMILPMLTNPFGLAIIAITAVVGGLIYLRKQLDNAAKEAARAGAEIGGVANSMKVIEEATGFKPPTLEDRLFRFTDEDREAMAEFGSYFESEAGSKFIKDLREATSEERYLKVSTMLAQAVASGLEEEKAKAFGFAIAEATGDALLKSSIARDFANQIFGEGSQTLIDLEKERLKLIPNIDSRVSRITRFGAYQRSMPTIEGTDPNKITVTTEGYFQRLLRSINVFKTAADLIFGQAEKVEKVKVAAEGLGFALQTIQNLTNAEAVLEQERRDSLIEFPEYTERLNEIRGLQEDASEYIGEIFAAGANQPAMMQALGDQLSFADFSEDQIKRITQRFNPEALTKQFFGDDKKFEDLTEDQRTYVEQVLTRVLSGLTPENVGQRLADIEGTYTDMAQEAVQAMADGLIKGIGGLDLFFNQQNIEDFITERMGGGYRSGAMGVSPEQMAQNIMSQDMPLKEAGTDALEVFAELAEFTDQDLAKSIMASKARVLEFGKSFASLKEFEKIDIELFIQDPEFDAEELKSELKKIADIEFDKETFGEDFAGIRTAVMSAMPDPQEWSNAMQGMGVPVEEFFDRYKGAAQEVGQAIVDVPGKTKEAFDKAGNLRPRVALDVVTNLLGGVVDNPEAMANRIVNSIPELNPLQLMIMVSLGGEGAALLADPNFRKAVEAGENIAVTEYVGGAAGVATRTTQYTQEQLDMGAIIFGAGGFGPSGSGVKDKPKDTSGGSASKEKSALQELEESILERANLYLGVTKAGEKLDKSKKNYEKKIAKETTTNNSLANQLRKRGVSETLITDILAKGSENARKIMDELGPNGLRRMSVGNIVGLAGDFIEGQRAEVTRAGYKETARTRLEQTGRFTEEEIENILEDEEATEILATLPQKYQRVWKQLINSLRQTADATAEVKTEAEKLDDLLTVQEDAFDRFRTAMEQGFDAAEIEAADGIAKKFFDDNTGLAEKLAKSTGHTVENGYQLAGAMERQILLNQRLIDQEQDKIDKKQEEISDYQRSNDLIQQGIDNLKREDETRNRRSESLSRDLEQIAQAEQEIRDSYQERIDQLDKVAKANEHLIQQQQKQLNLSRAISEGDIYAATQAVQEMRAASAQQAVDQRRAAMERGMELSIEGLTNAEGMTRAEIEEEINNIKEQNYQNSLKIRIEEDKIYANNLEIRRLTNEIYDIQENLIEPLENQNKEYSRMLDYYRQDEEYAIKRVTLAGLTREEFEKQADALELAITNAQNLDPWLEGLAGRYADIWTNAKNAADEAARLARLQGEAKKKEEDEANNKYAGGLIKKYAMGGIVNPLKYTSNEPPPAQKRASGGAVFGVGSRDSVAAMLTPGEFVIRKAMVDKYGLPLMEALNQGSFYMPRYNTGPQTPQVDAMGGSMVSNINAPVYNTYDMKFSINGTNQSADEIANKVMFKMRQLQSQGVRSNRGY